MIYCLNCGKGIPDQSKFCTFCGTAIKTVDTPADATIRENIDRSKANEQAARDRTTQHDHDQHRTTNQRYIEKDGNEHLRTTPVSHDHISPTASHQDNLTSAANQHKDVRNEDLHNRSSQSFIPNNSTSVKDHPLTHSKNSFYQSIGFWVAVLAIVGLFVLIYFLLLN